MFTNNWNDSNSSMSINETQSLICAARNIQQEVSLPYSTTWTMILRSFEIIFNILVIVFGTLLNSLVLVLVKKFKSLQTLSFAIALQVIVIDLITVSIHNPTSLVTALANKWVFGKYVCIIGGFAVFSTFLIRMVLMSTLVIDRFCNVFMPFYYPKRRKKIMLSLTLAAWSLTIFVSIILLPGLNDCYEFVPEGWGCYASPQCNRPCTILSNVIFSLIVLPSGIVPIFLYSVLFWKAKKIKKSTASAANDLTDNGNTTRREWRATITFFLLFMAVFVVTVPPVFLFFILELIFPPSTWLNIIRLFSSNMIPLLVILDPLFIMRDRDMRIAMAQLKWVPNLFC